MRAKSRWNKPGKAHTPEAIASVLNAVAWNAATHSVLEMEKGGLQADTQLQRLTVIAEFMAFLVHVADRLAAIRMDVDERGRFINALGVQAADLMAGNLADLQSPGDYRASFIDTLNERMSEYAEFGFSEASGPDIGFLRGFGRHVTVAMGPHDQRWILEYVMEVAAPESIEILAKTVRNLLV